TCKPTPAGHESSGPSFSQKQPARSPTLLSPLASASPEYATPSSRSSPVVPASGRQTAGRTEAAADIAPKRGRASARPHWAASTQPQLVAPGSNHRRRSRPRHLHSSLYNGLASFPGCPTAEQSHPAGQTAAFAESHVVTTHP